MPLVCSVCNEPKEKTDYSKKQLKAKGRRKCKACAQLSSAAAQQQNKAESERKKAPSHQFIALFNGAAKNTVKRVLAEDVRKVQEKMGVVKRIPGQDKYDVLLKWLRDGGAKFPHLQLKYYTVDYRGVHARKRLDAQELILEVPLPLIMTSEVAKASRIGQAIRESGCQLASSHSWLAAFLLTQKYDPNSFYRPYIDTLPVHYRNMPIFFDMEELKQLTGSFALKMIEDRKISLKLEFDNIVSHVPWFSQYHHLDFAWARLAVITRIFGFEVKGRKTDGLVAMADMLNHKEPHETSWKFDAALNSFTIITTKRLLKGGQVFDSYGRKCNSRFFVNYGFTLDFNQDNQVAMYFQFPEPAPTDPIAAVKAKLITTEERRFQIPFEHKERVTRKCVSYLRIWHATLEELMPLTKLESVIKIDPISIPNEAKVMRHIAQEAKRVLAGFPTTLEEDEKMLAADKSLTMNMRNCVIMRRGEKQILHAYIDLARTIDVVEKMNARELRKEVNSRGKEPTIAWRKEMYFDELWMPLLTGVKKELEEMNNSLGE